ncbi:MAG: hypothetical protein K2Q34_03845 [Alphaproteobacteria bacterium]|nr:hypothetical protein [Alphaproteobacteria bacterium]
MKIRVLILGFLSLLWIGMAEASGDFMSDMPPEAVAALRLYTFTTTPSIQEQLGVFKKMPEYFKSLAAGLIPFKERMAEPSPKAVADRIPLKELTEDELPPPSPIASEPEFEAYEEEEMISCITQLCFPAAASHYEQGIRALFRSGKPPKHNAKHLTEGLQCLGSKMLFARALVEKVGLDAEIGNSLQMTAINQVLKFHHETLPLQDPVLWAQIPPAIPGCPRCLGLPKLTPK